MDEVGVNPEFWSGRRVFLTGHTGFKGSWLSLWLQELGAKVTGYALDPPTFPSLFLEAEVGKGMDAIQGDIRDGKYLYECIKASQAEIVFHMAAQPLVRYSYEAPVETYETNVLGTVNLLEGVRQSGGVRSLVNVTTDKCYQNLEWDWGYRESDRLGGHDPYSNSKACAELVTQSYRSAFFSDESYPSHGLAMATARAGNVIGGGDWAKDRLIPDILRSFEAGLPVTIRNPGAIRPWQHVLEPLGAYLKLAERLHEKGCAFSGAWNVGPSEGDTQTVEWITRQMAMQWGLGALWDVDRGQHPHEASFLKLDISKARNRLGWHPQLRLEEALDWTVSWSKKRQQGLAVKDITLDQIRNYQTRINQTNVDD